MLLFLSLLFGLGLLDHVTGLNENVLVRHEFTQDGI